LEEEGEELGGKKDGGGEGGALARMGQAQGGAGQVGEARQPPRWSAGLATENSRGRTQR
jgi:hypothetical protein